MRIIFRSYRVDANDVCRHKVFLCSEESYMRDERAVVMECFYVLLGPQAGRSPRYAGYFN